MSKKVFREVRYCFYLAGILNCILVEWIVPLKFKCSFTEETCIACGLRTAIRLLLDGDYEAAYSSNPLIVLCIFALIFMIFDISKYIMELIVSKIYR